MSWISSAFDIASDLAGAWLGGRANERAADTQADAMREGAELYVEDAGKARDEFREAAGRGIDAIRAGYGEAREVIRPQTQYQPSGMTTAQEIGREDVRRGALANLAASGLRGAGRSGVAAIGDIDARYVARALDDNAAVRRTAENRIASNLETEGANVANTEIGAGSNIGATYLNQGGVRANTAAGIGDIEASSDIATTKLWGDAIGGIGAIIADEVAAEAKDVSRDPYEGRKARVV